MMAPGKIKIEGDGSAQGTKVHLDGQDISHFVQHVQVSISVDHEPRVTLYLVGSVELPDELKAHIEVETSEEELDLQKWRDDLQAISRASAMHGHTRFERQQVRQLVAEVFKEGDSQAKE